MIRNAKNKLFVLGFLLLFLTPVMSNSQQHTALSDLPEVSQHGGSEFVYSPVGRRDPFAPLVQEINKAIKKPRKNLGPLEKYELSQFRLLAMLIVKGSPRAMVKAPDGKSYTVKLGDLIGMNGGFVKRIETKQVGIDNDTGQRIEKSPDRIVVEESLIDNFSGKVINRETYISM